MRRLLLYNAVFDGLRKEKSEKANSILGSSLTTLHSVVPTSITKAGTTWAGTWI